jgi:hypothetical protein
MHISDRNLKIYKLDLFSDIVFDVFYTNPLNVGEINPI